MTSKKSKIFVAGHSGLVGSAVLRRLKYKGYQNIITVDKKKVNLINQDKTFQFLKEKKPDFIIICAAKVGGIMANNIYKGEFIYENLQIQNNLINGAYRNGIKKLIFLGSSCVYPKFCKQPIKEKYLLDGKLEKTNEPYAIAKIAGIKLCESYNFQYKTNFKCLMPTNTFGPNDNYNETTSHFIPALISKIHKLKNKKKKELKIWGTGTAKREVIFVDDLADACIFFMKKKTKETLINIGTGKDYTISQYAKKIMKILKIKANISYDKSKPNGTPQKLLDNSLSKSYGWRPKISFEKGIKIAYQHYIRNV